jgi:hypothetical protein
MQSSSRNPKRLSAARATALLRLLKLNSETVWRDLNRLLLTEYDRTDAFKWFSPKWRGPSPAAALYLRMKLQEAWSERRRRRQIGRTTAGDASIVGLRRRVEAILASGGDEVLERFEKRISLTEGDLARQDKPVPDPRRTDDQLRQEAGALSLKDMIVAVSGKTKTGA